MMYSSKGDWILVEIRRVAGDVLRVEGRTSRGLRATPVVSQASRWLDATPLTALVEHAARPLTERSDSHLRCVPIFVWWPDAPHETLTREALASFLNLPEHPRWQPVVLARRGLLVYRLR